MLWLVHAVVRVVHSAVLGEESVRGSCGRTQLTSASARACGLWFLTGCSSVGSVVLAAEVSSACAPKKVRFGFGELESSVGRWCLRCAGAVGRRACKAGLHRNRGLCWECLGEAWSLNTILSPAPLGRAHPLIRLVEDHRAEAAAAWVTLIVCVCVPVCRWDQCTQLRGGPRIDRIERVETLARGGCSGNSLCVSKCLAHFSDDSRCTVSSTTVGACGDHNTKV